MRRRARLQSLVLERLAAPAEVRLLDQFEELGRQFCVEQPPLARTQLELLFRCYDGHKLQLPAADQDEEPDSAAARQAAPPTGARRARFGWRRLLAAPAGSLACCLLGRSDTQPQLSASSSAASAECQGAWQRELGVSEAAEADPEEEAEAGELARDVCRLLGPLLVGGQSGGGQSGEEPQQQQQQQQVGDPQEVGGQQVSVCLFDKRPTEVRLEWEAESARLRDELARRLGHLAQGEADANASKIAAELNRWLAKSRSRCGRRLGLSKDQLRRLIGLAKDSLNQLIDAQLLLRNKLASEREQQQQQGVAIGSNAANAAKLGAEYEILLRNNFNLLKIWQNLEETKRLACFVCEPIKATLADLFWFSRQPQELSWALWSPTLALDGLQVKRGLLQILEALAFLHSICKLIHRNVSPRNILIGAQDNWKLGGLEFALRFESAACAPSASLLAHEPSILSAPSSSLPASGAAAARAAKLRRQRTLHQTKCEELNGARENQNWPMFQPELDYLAPELWRQAKCSHKSDLFSFGLVAVQTYDRRRHRPTLDCRWQCDRYERQLHQLKQQRARLVRRCPLEMRPLVGEMLDQEPNLRPSANYAIQQLRRPLELAAGGRPEESLRHLRLTLAYLDTGNINNTPNCARRSENNPPRRPSYFKRVTSCPPPATPRRPTRNLHLLGLLCRALDAVLRPRTSGAAPAEQQVFGQLRRQFLLALDCARQLYARDAFADSRALLLALAVHRRLLELLGQMRAELPAAGRIQPGAHSSPLAQNQRQLCELELELHALVSRRSLAHLAASLADPLLKLDEFLLVHELLADLLAFSAQKCRQQFLQRGKQLLAELTPVTGCPALSSSDEEEEEEEDRQQQQQQLDDEEPLDEELQSPGMSFGGSHRFGEYEPARPSRNHLPATTRISITGPSPATSMREVHRAGRPLDQDERELVEGAGRLSIGSADEPAPNDDDDKSSQELDAAGGAGKSRSQLIDELLQTINDDSFNEPVHFGRQQPTGRQRSPSAAQLANAGRPRSAMGDQSQPANSSSASSSHSAGAAASRRATPSPRPPGAPSTFDNVIRRMSTNLVQNFNKMSSSGGLDDSSSPGAALRRERSSQAQTGNSLYVDNQAPVRRHSDNTINVPRIQVALSSPGGSRTNLNQRSSASASKLANKWKTNAKSSRRESSDKLSPNLGGALGYMRRHSSGNTAGNEHAAPSTSSNGPNLLFNSSPFKTKSSSNLGLDFLLSNRSMKRRCSAASMLGHQTQRKAEDLIDAGMKSVQNMFS